MRTLLTPNQLTRLEQRYAESNRHYHTLTHITVMFQLATVHGLRLSIPQQLAIWYHDSVYEVHEDYNKNEELSVAYMRGALSENIWISEVMLERASNIILATKRHVSTDHEAQTIIDLDLAGLGFDWDTYEAAGAKVRMEFAHISENDWMVKRKIFLKSMLAREHIFYTPWARDYYEKKARRNLHAELDQMLHQVSTGAFSNQQ